MANDKQEHASATRADARWAAVVTRNPAADGAFVYAVASTGVYCRPSCPSRLAKPENVVFYATPAAAEQAGFRPCKRCQPERRSPAAQRMAMITALCRLIDHSEQAPTLAEMAAHCGISPFYLHRLFKLSTGLILVAQSGRGVCAILIGDDPKAMERELRGKFPAAGLIGGDAGFELLLAKVVALIDKPGLGLDLPLDIRGTAFQQRVWQALREIPTGATLSYTEIAQRIGSPKSVRAVAGACAANLLAVAIPCHRVVGKDGSLRGYRWGVECKRLLLEREAAQ